MDGLTPEHIQAMVTHWLSTPPNGYLGSSYGSDVASLLQTPTRSGQADALIAKMKKDIPALGALPSGTINVYMERIGNDKVKLLIQVGDVVIPYEQIETAP